MWSSLGPRGCRAGTFSHRPRDPRGRRSTTRDPPGAAHGPGDRTAVARPSPERRSAPPVARTTRATADAPPADGFAILVVASAVGRGEAKTAIEVTVHLRPDRRSPPA